MIYDKVFSENNQNSPKKVRDKNQMNNIYNHRVSNLIKEKSSLKTEKGSSLGSLKI